MKQASLMMLAALTAAPALAQYGQYPPGNYPGQDPNGPGGGLSLPRWGKKKNSAKKKDAVPNFNQDGWVAQSSGSELHINTDDGRLITMKVDQDTKFTKDGSTIPVAQLTPNAFVHVEAFEDDGWFLTAASVDVRKDPGRKTAATELPQSTPPPEPAAPKPVAETKPPQGTPTDENTVPSPDSLGAPPDVPGRPKLHHGAPSAQDKAGEDEEVTAAAPPRARRSSPNKNEAGSDSGDSKDGSIDFTVGDEKTEAKHKPSSYGDLISRTREWSEAFSQGLPNFVCEQVTTRYQENSRADGFQPLDVISAKVIYEDGKEDYQQITVGGRRTNKSMLDLGGSTSTGEFASTLRSLFSGYVNAQFKFRESSSIDHTAIAIYDLKVLLPRSDWTVTIGAQQWHPGYSGSVWVDKATSEVRRIEIEAESVPKNYPADTVAETVDYEPVSLGTAKFLLPVHSENLSCFRGTSICTKNAIDFRDYHKFEGQSTVEFK